MNLSPLLPALIVLNLSTAQAQVNRDEAQIDAACFASLSQAPVSLTFCEEALQSRNGGTQLQDGFRRARLQSALAMLHARKHDARRARELMNNALSLAADDLTVAVNNGNLLLREGAFQQSLDVYNRVVVKLLESPSKDVAHTELAVLYRNRSLALRAVGRYDEAQLDYRLYQEMSGDYDYAR